MKSGLPCRADHDCEIVFRPEDDKTLQSILDAATQRDAHEVTVHDYRHRIIDTETHQTWNPSRRNQGGANDSSTVNTLVALSRRPRDED
jgi:hypothetical protein